MNEKATSRTLDHLKEALQCLMEAEQVEDNPEGRDGFIKLAESQLEASMEEVEICTPGERRLIGVLTNSLKAHVAASLKKGPWIG